MANGADADLDVKDKDGDTPLTEESRDHSSIVALLEDHMYPLHATAKEGNVDEMMRLLDDGAAIDQTKDDGATPLYVACEKGHVDAARLLLDKGAEVDRATKDGATPLWVAC